LHELDPKLTETELDGIIEEIDEDGSGTVDFDGENQEPILPRLNLQRQGCSRLECLSK
jgi:hypothetical protein